MKRQEKLQAGEGAVEVALSSPKVFVPNDTFEEGHDPKQLVARLKSPTPKPDDACKGMAEIEVCDPLLAKRLDEQREKASPGQVRRVYSKPKPATLEPLAAAAPAACERDTAEERPDQVWHQASEEHAELTEEIPVQAEQERAEPSAAETKPDDLPRSALTLPMAACTVAVVAAAAGLMLTLYARVRPAL